MMPRIDASSFGRISTVSGLYLSSDDRWQRHGQPRRWPRRSSAVRGPAAAGAGLMVGLCGRNSYAHEQLARREYASRKSEPGIHRAAKRRYRRNRYVETARAEMCDEVHFVGFEPPSVVPTKFVVTVLGSSGRAPHEVQHPHPISGEARRRQGGGVTIRYAPADLRVTLSDSQNSGHLLRFEIRASPGAGGAGAAAGRRQAKPAHRRYWPVPSGRQVKPDTS